MGHLNGFFCPEGREFEQANLQKFKCPGGLPGGLMLKLRFDWYINTVIFLLGTVPGVDEEQKLA